MNKNNTGAPEKDIVSFNQALELCSIGYDEPTFCMYEIENRQLCLCHIDEDGLYMPDKDFHAPTKSQVFRWFREKYELGHTICPYYFNANITELQDVDDYPLQHEVYVSSPFTYEEAENAAINKLIEIVNQ